ncbi:hypothetical protein C9890_0682, partial [Perkinsus sp. BL_2016]
FANGEVMVRKLPTPEAGDLGECRGMEELDADAETSAGSDSSCAREIRWPGSGWRRPVTRERSRGDRCGRREHGGMGSSRVCIIVNVFERQRRKHHGEQNHSQTPNIRSSRPIPSLLAHKLRRQEAFGAGCTRAAAPPNCIREPISLPEIRYQQAGPRRIGRQVN